MIPSVLSNSQSPFGLKQDDLNTIIAVIERYTSVEEAIMYGSRAKGNYKDGSDIDIALKGAKVNNTTTTSISYLLNEETYMPYHFDVLNYHAVSSNDLVKHIDRIGLCFYKRG